MSAKKKTSHDASKEAGETRDAQERDAQADDGGEESPESDMEKLAREKGEHYDRLLRVQAEFDNYRKRVQKEHANLLKYGSENALREILPAIDSIQLAVDSARAHDNSDTRLLEGIEMIRNQFVSVLEKMGVRPVETVGHPFDPNKHDALLRVHAPESDEGMVVGDIRKGYYLHDKILRPAQVVVGTREDTQAPSPNDAAKDARDSES